MTRDKVSQDPSLVRDKRKGVRFGAAVAAGAAAVVSAIALSGDSRHDPTTAQRDPSQASTTLVIEKREGAVSNEEVRHEAIGFATKILEQFQQTPDQDKEIGEAEVPGAFSLSIRKPTEIPGQVYRLQAKMQKNSTGDYDPETTSVVQIYVGSDESGAFPVHSLDMYRIDRDDGSYWRLVHAVKNEKGRTVDYISNEPITGSSPIIQTLTLERLNQLVTEANETYNGYLQGRPIES